MHSINIKENVVRKWVSLCCTEDDKWASAMDMLNMNLLMNDCIPKTILSKDGQDIQNIKVFFIIKYIIICNFYNFGEFSSHFILKRFK